MILTEKISELLGIILGDGHVRYNISEHSYSFSIYLNGVDEKEYLSYVKSLIFDIYEKEPFENWERDKPSTRDNAKGVSLTLYGKELVKDLLDLGLQSGSKVKNQVGIPRCVLSSDKFIIKCLKGLFDTDGSLYVNKSRKSIYLSFSNGSINLVKGFNKFCKKIGIISLFFGPYCRLNKETGKISKEYKAYILQKEMVKKFLDIINPEKWKDKNRIEFMGTLLILLKNPENYINLIREYNLKFQNKQFKYSIQSLRFLKNFCNSIKLKVNELSIKSVVEESFEFKYLKYSIEYAEYLKDLSIKKGSIREVVKHINKKYRITANNYIKRLFTEPEYSELYGKKGYSRWVNHNFEVLIDDLYDTNISKRVIRIRRFSFDIKKEMCILIFNILKSSSSQKSDSSIIKELSYLIHNLDLNSRLLKGKNLSIHIEGNEYKPKALLFERLSFLLSNSEYISVLNDHFSILLIFVKEILRLINLKEKMDLENLRKHLRNKLKINWRSDNIKKILVALQIYEVLIVETKQYHSSQKTKSLEELKNKNEEIPNETLENRNTVKNPKNYYQLINLNHSNLVDEDFRDPYLWISPQVREAIHLKAEMLTQQIHEDVSAHENFSDQWEDISIYDNSDLESKITEEIIDNHDVDIIPDQDLEPDPEVSEIQESQEADDINNTIPNEEVEDQINDLEQINEPESREVDLRPDDFDSVNEPPYDPISQPVTEIIPPSDPPAIPDNVIPQQQKNDPETQESPQSQREQEEDSQIPEKSQDEVGTEKSIEQDQIPELSDSGPEDSPDKPDANPEEPENTTPDESKEPPNLDEKDEDSDKISEETEDTGDEEEEAKDENKEESDKDELNEDPDEEKEDSKEGEEDSDNDAKEENDDDMDDLGEESENGFNPEDLYDPINMIDYSGIYPQITSFQSSNFGLIPIEDIDFTDNFGEKDNLPGINDCIDNFGEDRDEKIPIDGFDELSGIDDEEDKFFNFT